MLRFSMLVVLCGAGCFAGCAELSAFVLRELSTDHEYRREVRRDFRRALQGRRGSPAPFPAPEGLDRG